MANQHLSKNLIRLREKNGYSLEYVARMLDTDEKRVRLWESGESEPSNDELLLLSKLYSVEMAALLSEMVSGEPQAKAEAPENTPPPPPHTEAHNLGDFAEYLAADERLLWTGKPDQNHITEKSLGGGCYEKVFSVFWLGFAIFWTVMATAGGGPFGLFGLPFIAIGIYLLFGKKSVLNQQKAATDYAITDKRILIRNSHKGTRFFALSHSDPFSISLHEGEDGFGTIELSGGAAGDYRMLYTGHYRGHRQNNLDPELITGYLTHNLVDIPECGRVYRLLTELKRTSTDP